MKKTDLSIQSKWFRPLLFLVFVFVIYLLLPEGAIDPWGAFSPKQVLKIIFALTLIQIIGLIAIENLGSKMGYRLTGFLGGLISSTATTVLVAKKSKEENGYSHTYNLVTILSSTVGMLIEVAIIIIVGTKTPFISLIFLGPIVVTELIIFFLLKHHVDGQAKVDVQDFKISSIVKLALFIVLILGISKASQYLFGESGLFLLTFLVSLFEMHGSIVANTGLFSTGQFSSQVLIGLVTLSAISSYLSKFFLIVTIGSPSLKKSSLKYFSMVLVSIVLSWLAFVLFFNQINPQ